MLADLVRGAGGGAFSVSSGTGGRKRKSLSKEKVGLDLDAVAGGKVTLGKDVSCIASFTEIDAQLVFRKLKG